ncbi:MAG: tetratricopeptide repeat protein [Deltaproteobacteria bacterium]|nr:tetratricopeptide repeat protein [Deltaproteobacteria bacterium]
MNGPSRMNLRLVFLTGSILLSPSAKVGFAAALPDSYPLNRAASGPTPVDPSFSAWLALHAKKPSPLELPEDQFTAMLASQDQITTAFLKLARMNTPEINDDEDEAAELVGPPRNLAPNFKPPESRRQVVEGTFKILKASGDLAGSAADSHPLLPFLYLNLLKSPELDAGERAAISQRFNQSAAGTCASKQSLLVDLTSDKLTPLNDDDLRALLQRIDRYRSRGFKQLALKRVILNLPEPRRRTVGDSILAVAQSYPALVATTPWLSQLAESSGKTVDSHEPEASFNKARQLAGKKQCGKAKDLMLGGLHIAKGLSSLTDATNTGKVIDGCFRAQDTKLRAEFWQNITKAMSDTYGFDGWAEARLRLGFIDWSRNKFDEARKAFEDVAAKAATKYKKYEARAVYSLARIAENQGELERAAVLYEDYLSRFAKEENYDEAMMALGVNLAGRGEWQKVLEPLKGLINSQSGMPVDERSASSLSFALFWSGRAYLELGKLSEASEMWRRVASEYYSTYYGALGHYMLEKVTGQHLAMQPARLPRFRPEMLQEPFSSPDQQKIRRIEALMRIGLHHDAVCEMEEVDIADGKPEKLIVKALVTYAAGKWLDAVKIYDALPRSFRSSLPAGFERILYPQKFAEEVRAFAAKVGVDADFVFAIIRQESVFNPLARSPVGALGLMQIMPQTAQLEMRQVGSDYMGNDVKKAVLASLSAGNGLLTPDVNLQIGVHHVRSLLDKYLSPIYLLSAYNAGPAAAQRWITTLPTRDPLVFVERIPYKETRGYVKLVLRNYFYYKRLYNDAKQDLRHFDTVADALVASVRSDHAAAAAVEAEKPPKS